MATSRFAHYLKVMARDWIGSFMEAENCEDRLNKWIKNYVNSNVTASQEIEGQVPATRGRWSRCRRSRRQPGTYNAIAFIRPWLQLEELTASLRMVARIPALSK